MRLNDRLHIGIALAGMVFCLTTPLALVAHAAHRVSAPNAPTFRDLSDDDLTTDGSVVVLRGDGAWHPPIAVISPYDHVGAIPFSAIANSVNQAGLTRASALYPYELVFYRPTGQLDRTFYANPDGVLMDATTRLHFQAAPILQTYLEQIDKS